MSKLVAVYASSTAHGEHGSEHDCVKNHDCHENDALSAFPNGNDDGDFAKSNAGESYGCDGEAFQEKQEAKNERGGGL